MNNIFIEYLPPWVETGLQPAFYDKESGTVLQQTARMYAKVHELTKAFNDLSAETKSVVDEYIAKFIELHDYVHDYFDNLDVQEEINNKLDDMVEEGTLQEIITTYIQSNVKWTFDNIASLKLATNFSDGSFAQTLGYSSVGDGGASTYKVRTKTEYDTPDDAFLIQTADDTLVAELVIDETLNVKQVGAKGDGVTDDTTVLRNMFTKCRSKNITSIYFPKGKYLVTNTLLDYGIDGVSISGDNDDIYDNSTIILRGADVTVFNFGGVMTLDGISEQAGGLLLKNITLRDSADTYTSYPFATLHYTQHFTIANCSISCKNKALDLRHCYDSRFINTDFTAGGNSTDAMVVIHGGKHASPDTIGWDSANCITFDNCRFERYYGTAVKTTKEVQPDTYNTNYDPCVATNANTIWFNACRFEAPTLLTGKHLDFNSTNSIRLNIQMTVLDGQTGLKPINFDSCIGVFGEISVGYNQSTIGGASFANFEEPIINVLNNSGKFNIDLIVTNIYNHYQLDYFVHIVAGDNTRRTINFNLIYNGTSKKLYDQDSSNQNLMIYKQGRETRYGRYENGFGLKMDNTANNTYFANMSYDSGNARYQLEKKYTTTGGSNRTLETVSSDDNFSHNRFDTPSTMNNTLMIIPNKHPSSKMSSFRSAGSTSRAIMFGSTYPNSEETDVLYKAGDIIFNITPTAGGTFAWVCTGSGNPGTWKAVGGIEA